MIIGSVHNAVGLKAKEGEDSFSPPGPKVKTSAARGKKQREDKNANKILCAEYS
jgi:hypothetical protein